MPYPSTFSDTQQGVEVLLQPCKPFMSSFQRRPDDSNLYVAHDYVPDFNTPFLNDKYLCSITLNAAFKWNHRCKQALVHLEVGETAYYRILDKPADGMVVVTDFLFPWICDDGHNHMYGLTAKDKTTMLRSFKRQINVTVQTGGGRDATTVPRRRTIVAGEIFLKPTPQDLESTMAYGAVYGKERITKYGYLRWQSSKLATEHPIAFSFPRFSGDTADHALAALVRYGDTCDCVLDLSDAVEQLTIDT